MNTRTTLATLVAAITLVTAAGCAVTRGQETVGAYVDDATITTQIKGRFIEDPVVAASSIRVETLNGTVMLSGFAKSAAERNTAEAIARRVNGVKSIKNEIAVRP
jgi:osmotically-inducible protein OsmY